MWGDTFSKNTYSNIWKRMKEMHKDSWTHRWDNLFKNDTHQGVRGCGRKWLEPNPETIQSKVHVIVFFFKFFYLLVVLCNSVLLLLLVHPLSTLSLSFLAFIFCFFFVQVVLSHCQHQHLIKPKDKHGPQSTAELISSRGSISQLLSICPNTNLLFFTAKVKKKKKKRSQKQHWQINITWPM